jgi:hypothetical protein
VRSCELLAGIAALRLAVGRSAGSGDLRRAQMPLRCGQERARQRARESDATGMHRVRMIASGGALARRMAVSPLGSTGAVAEVKFSRRLERHPDKVEVLKCAEPFVLHPLDCAT